MTIRELRKEFKKKINSLKNLWGLDELAEFFVTEWAAYEELYREGTVKRFSNEFLGRANHYQFYRQAHKNLSILQTYDLHSISATKKVTRDMMAMFLNVGDWSCGYIREGGKYVEVEEETTAPEAEQTAETAEQKTELDTEVEAEQTENNAESISETHDSKDVKIDISKTGELSVTTKTLMAFSFVASEYLKQIGYIDTS